MTGGDFVVAAGIDTLRFRTPTSREGRGHARANIEAFCLAEHPAWETDPDEFLAAKRSFAELAGMLGLLGDSKRIGRCRHCDHEISLHLAMKSSTCSRAGYCSPHCQRVHIPAVFIDD